MRATLLAVVVANAFASSGDGQALRAGVDKALVLSKEEVCRLVVLAARKELVVPPHRANLLAQPATTELAGEHGRIWMDVVVTQQGRSRYPLVRGESCGDQELVELCDWERLRGRCSRDRKERERWRVVILLTLIDDDHVDSMVSLVKPPRLHRQTTEATASPVPSFYGHFQRGQGGWREGVAPKRERRPSTGENKSAGADAGAR